MTPPVADDAPSVPFVVKPVIVTEFDGRGKPPSMKSNASWANVPAIGDVSIKTLMGAALALPGNDANANTKRTCVGLATIPPRR
jgi:hypothetical protein